MCVLIDPGCIPKVFNPTDARHLEFKPVLTWIKRRKGRIVWGGSKYSAELKNCSKYFRVFGELEKRGDVARLSMKEVDQVAEDLKKTESRQDFDDEHLVAIVRVSQCSLVCTSDKTAAGYLKEARLYTGCPARPPKIYSRKRNQDLLRAVRCPPIPRK